MIVDSFNTLTSPSVVSAATYYSTDHIDLMPVSATSANSTRTTNSQIDLGEGQQLYAIVTVTTAFAGATNYTFQVISGTTGVNGGTTAPSNAVVHGTTAAIVPGSLTAGRQLVIPISPLQLSDGAFANTTGFNRYLAFAVVATGGTPTAGVAQCNITLQAADGKTFYKSGFTVASL
jgi:hypothetical protein